MSNNARLILFGLAVTMGAVLAALKVISGDAWLTLTLGLLLPSPLDGKMGRPGSGAGIGAGVAALGAFFLLRAPLLLGLSIRWIAGVNP